MMNANFERLSIACFVIISSTAHTIAQEFSDITWTREDRSDECTKFIFDMPASLVPLYSKGTPAMESQWKSFDGKFLFWYSDNITPGHLNLYSLSRAQYVKWTRCLDADKLAHKCWESDHSLARARMSEKNIWFGEGKALCMEVDAVSPANSNDRSRFGAMLQMCGPPAANKLIRSSVDRILRSLDYSYLGCCKPRDNVSGCK
jgi:hypothetical protein